MKNAVYLDYNATAPLKPAVIACMTAALNVVGNASSVHVYGRDARKRVEDAREQVAAMVNARPNQVIFNSCATEGNNTVLSMYAGKDIWISEIEHSSVIASLPDARRIPVTRNGIIDLDALAAMFKAHTAPALISVMYVNNELGTIQPVKEIAALARAHGTLVLCDAVQAAGRLPIDMKDMDVDFITLSAHKLGGPQGVGAMIFRSGIVTRPLIKGGGQERRQRSGTENVAGIAAFGLACDLAVNDMDTYQRITPWRDAMEKRIAAEAPKARIFCTDAPRVGNTSVISLPGISSDTLLMNLDMAGYAVSSGSACSSGVVQPSRVLKAMGATDAEAIGALRISGGWASTEDDFKGFTDAFIALYKRLEQKITD